MKGSPHFQVGVPTDAKFTLVFGVARGRKEDHVLLLAITLILPFLEFEMQFRLKAVPIFRTLIIVDKGYCPTTTLNEG